jgi:hypothetical protein
LWTFDLGCFNAGESIFVDDTRGENEVGLSAVRLELTNGVVTRIVDDWLNGAGPGLGEITRRES